MRHFDDSNGARWQAALLNASYGQIMLIFSPAHGGDSRRQLLAAENLAAAEAHLASLDDAALREMLADADSFDPGAGVI